MAVDEGEYSTPSPFKAVPYREERSNLINHGQTEGNEEINGDKINHHENNARTTTEEDIYLLSRPIYNFDPKNTLSPPKNQIETSSSQIKTLGNTDDSRDRIFQLKDQEENQ